MFTLTIGNKTIKRYKLQWHDHNGRRNNVEHTRVMHSVSLDAVKDKAMLRYGSKPDAIHRI